MENYNHLYHPLGIFPFSAMESLQIGMEVEYPLECFLGSGVYCSERRRDQVDDCRISKGEKMDRPFKPTKEQVAAARGKSVPDLISPGLKVLFCGINPGLYTAAVGHHFGRPGNRFWPALHQAGFTPRQFTPFEEKELLGLGYGIVNIVDHATARADELTAEELAIGGARLEEKIRVNRPCLAAVLGVGAYRVAFRRPKALPGLQEEKLAGICPVWVLPNPSGLNANYQMGELVRMMVELRMLVENEC